MNDDINQGVHGSTGTPPPIQPVEARLTGQEPSNLKKAKKASSHATSASLRSRVLKALKSVLYSFAGICATLATVIAAGTVMDVWEYFRFPNDYTVRRRFEEHKQQLIVFSDILKNTPTLSSVEEDGSASSTDGTVPEEISSGYRRSMESVGCQTATIGKDRSIRFTMASSTRVGDTGVFYLPADSKLTPETDWGAVAVTSIDSKQLPQEKGHPVEGLYVAQVEPHWYIFRLVKVRPWFYQDFLSW